MKRAIVVGATSGIGRGIAKILVEHGYKVGITGRRTHLLNEIWNENTDLYIPRTFDVTDLSEISLNLKNLVLDLGGLDLLIISSGTGYISEKLDFSIEKKTVDVNVIGFTAVADWTYNYFEKQKYGHLVAISSVAGIRGNRFAPAYSASKAYQMNYMQGLRQRTAKLKMPLYITDIRPGFVDTAMAQSEYLFWVSSVDKAAKQIFMAIRAKRKVAYITKRWILIALIMKLLPSWIYNKA